MTGTGSISALAAYETNSPCLIETEGGFKHDTELKTVSVGQDRLGHIQRERAMELLRMEIEVTYALFQRAEAMGDLFASAQYVDRCYEAMGELRHLHEEANQGEQS
jgi:hypothetical protein